MVRACSAKTTESCAYVDCAHRQKVAARWSRRDGRPASRSSGNSKVQDMIQLDAPALAARLDRSALIDALDAAQPGGRAGTLLVMPAWRVGGCIGVKIATIFPDNALQGLPAVAATYLLLDAGTGQPRALLDGAELTLRRTGAASALASRYLSSAGASRLAMVGTGRLAPHLIESHAAVRPIREVRIWGRNFERARSLAAALDRPALSVEAAADLEEAVR